MQGGTKNARLTSLRHPFLMSLRPAKQNVVVNRETCYTASGKGEVESSASIPQATRPTTSRSILTPTP